MGNPMKVEVVKVACDPCDGNPHGFYECNADAVPKGAELFEAEPVEKALTVKEIKAKLTELEIEFNDKAKKPELLALLPEDKPSEDEPTE